MKHHYKMKWALLVWMLFLCSGATVAIQPADLFGGDNHPPAVLIGRGQLVDPVVLRNVVNVDCFQDAMHIYVDKLKCNVTEYSKIFLLEHEQSCMPTLRGSNDTHFIIATFYDECNTVQAGNFHVNQVTIRSGAGVLTQKFRCPAKEQLMISAATTSPTASDERPSVESAFRLRLSDVAQPYADTDIWPRKVYKGRRYKVVVEPVGGASPAATDPDLRALPDRCYIAEHSDPAKVRFKKILLEDGCPNNRGDRTVQVIHGVDGDKSTAFSFQITTVRYFPEEISMIYIHCDVVLCSIAGGRRSEGFIKCHTRTFCTEEGAVLNGNLEPLATQEVKHVLSGPLRTLERLQDESVQGECDCSQFDDAAATTATPAPAAFQHIVVQGLTFPTVIAIALVSFLIGAALVGSLWYIHSATQPSNVLGKRRNGSLDSRGSSLDSHTHLASPLTVLTPLPSTISSALSSLER